jgi:hypothetical protein
MRPAGSRRPAYLPSGLLCLGQQALGLAQFVFDLLAFRLRQSLVLRRHAEAAQDTLDGIVPLFGGLHPGKRLLQFGFGPCVRGGACGRSRLLDHVLLSFVMRA